MSARETRVGMRLPTDLVRSVDTYAREQAAETGARYTRTDAVRRLLMLALEQLGKGKKR